MSVSAEDAYNRNTVREKPFCQGGSANYRCFHCEGTCGIIFAHEVIAPRDANKASDRPEDS